MTHLKSIQPNLTPLVCAGFALWLNACQSLPSTTGRLETRAVPATTPGRLADCLQPVTANPSNLSSIRPIENGPEALAARLALAGAAERTLDVQYYIWHGDRSGKRLAAELLRAADRGVRVRVLLDDIGSSASDESLVLIHGHENIEVRLFNPVANRTAKLLGMLGDFGRANHRMHNKAFIADNQAAIVGGRNIGDEYFGADEEMNFADFDVMAAGPVVRELSVSFDAFWNSPLSIAISDLVKQTPTAETFAAQRAKLESDVTGAEQDTALEKRRQAFAARLLSGRLPFQLARATAVYDDPAKASGSGANYRSLASQVGPVLQASKRQVVMVSPYFVPGKKGVARLAEICRQGAQVIILTNSMASNDVPIVHSGYQHYRKALLEAGVRLYEFKPAAPVVASSLGIGSSPTAGLHAKTFTFDDKTFFVGSMNLDPRSVKWNTEAGVLVESPELTTRLSRQLLQVIENHAYHVTLQHGRLVWQTLESGKPVSLNTEPQTTGWMRFKATLLGWLPFEKQI